MLTSKKCNWIWLPQSLYPDNQTTVYSGFMDKSNASYTVAEFKRKYTFDKKVKSADLIFCGDTVFQLYCNDKSIATGPVCVGGDFIGNDKQPQKYFYSYATLFPNCAELDFFARVQMMPTQICHFSKGRGGFTLNAVLTFEDGTTENITTDESWYVRLNLSYNAPSSYDGRIKADNFVKAQSVEDIWQAEPSHIPVCEEDELFPYGYSISLAPFEEKEVLLELDMIYAGFLHITANTDGEVICDVCCRELEENADTNSLVFTKNAEYRDFNLKSCGNIFAKIKNNSPSSASIDVSFISTYYPVAETAETVTDNDMLNRVMRVCAHTLKYCRQTHHLDSPKHCEPLACTGDYYIESLMTLFSFGDMRLAEFDVDRTADLLLNHDGRLFHTTYSLIWVRMLYDVYMANKNDRLLEKCMPALKLLLNRFQTYIGDNGLIENPPDYMFIDWIYIDEISLHHPPKALGQTCLNMFYFGALDYAAKLYYLIGDAQNAALCEQKREALRSAVNTLLFDKQKNMYFEGLNTPTDEKLLYWYMPQNTDKRYYLKHANILAAYFGVCDDTLAKDLLCRIMSDEIKGDYQPYFAHYLFEAVLRCGLREKFTLEIAKKWEAPVNECSKGLVEGFIPPEPTYSFDHSHAWGGTPLYSVPKALLGLEIIEPKMRSIKLSPSLLGLKQATVELLTPFGKVVCKMLEGKEPEITHPKEIKIII